MKRKDSKNIHWNDVWTLPLYLDTHSGTYAWSKDNVMALMFNYRDRIPVDIKKDIIDSINGKEDIYWAGVWRKNGTEFYLEDKYVFCVRGWGHLIGAGAMNLEEDEAQRIQDEFIEYIYLRLSK
jgi:hypothetical protein